MIGSFPIEVETIMCGFIAFRVIFEIFNNPSTFREKIPLTVLYFWLMCFLPVLIGFYLGFESRNPNWTRGLRWLMISGSYFYGYILLEKLPNFRHSGIKTLIVTLIPMSFIILSLMMFNLFWSHHAFFLLSIGGAFSIYYLRMKSLIFFFLD